MAGPTIHLQGAATTVTLGVEVTGGPITVGHQVESGARLLIVEDSQPEGAP